MDRLSELPDEIIHNIIARIPHRHANLAAKLTILSKRWSHLWLSYPILEFDDESVDPFCDENVRGRLAAAPPGSTKLKGFSAATTKKFTAQSFTLNIEGIKVRLEYPSEELYRLLLDTLAMVSSREPENIDIYVRSLYPIALAPLINNRRLGILKLRGCKLGELSTYVFKEMINLRELYLLCMTIDDITLNSLIASAPSLEILKLESLEIHPKRLQICNHPKLKSILFDGVSVKEFIQIKGARSLETLEFLCSTGGEPRVETSTSTFRLLKIQYHSGRKASFLNNLISASPCLEELYLSEISEVDGLNIVNPSVQRVTLRRSRLYFPLRGKNTIRIDAPKLVRYECHESIGCLPSLSFATGLEASDCCVAYLSSYGVAITQEEFIDVKCFLAKLRPQFRFIRVSLFSFRGREDECTFDRDQIQDGTPAIVINWLYLNSYGLRNLPGLKAFFDGLFWTCLPLNLSIARSARYGSNDDWSKCLKRVIKLFAGRRRSHDCPRVACKCWRRRLKDFDTSYMTEKKEIIKLKTVGYDGSKVHRVSFKLTWYKH